MAYCRRLILRTAASVSSLDVIADNAVLRKRDDQESAQSVPLEGLTPTGTDPFPECWNTTSETFTPESDGEPLSLQEPNKGVKLLSTT